MPTMADLLRNGGGVRFTTARRIDPDQWMGTEGRAGSLSDLREERAEIWYSI